jgi:hypothetical protein
MSERIRELMKQAGTDTSGKWMGVEHAGKLVELVAKQCALTAGLMEQQGRTNIGAAILDLFEIDNESQKLYGAKNT